MRIQQQMAGVLTHHWKLSNECFFHCEGQHRLKSTVNMLTTSVIRYKCVHLTVCPLLQLENYIQESMKQDIVQLQQTVVHNHTATMIEIGTNLLSQTAEQTRKLTNVEAQVRQNPPPIKERKCCKKLTCYAGES